MSLLIHENKHSPLALVIAQGKPSIEQHIASLKSWDNWFNNNKPFHVIRFFKDSDSLEIPNGAGKMTQTWMAEGADMKFRSLVKSMCIVVPKHKYNKMKKMNINKVFGIPGGIFSSINDVFEWFNEQPSTFDKLGIQMESLNEIKNTIHFHQHS